MIPGIITFILPYLYIFFKNIYLIIYFILYFIVFYITCIKLSKKVFKELLNKNIDPLKEIKLTIIYIYLLSNIPILIYNYKICLIAFLTTIIIYIINLIINKLLNKYLVNNIAIDNYLKECYKEKDTALNKKISVYRINSFNKYLNKYNNTLFNRLFYYSLSYLFNFIYIILIIYLIKDFKIIDIIMYIFMSIYILLFIKYIKYLKKYYKVFKNKPSIKRKKIKHFKKINFKKVMIPGILNNFNITINNKDKIYIIGEDKDYTNLLNTLLNKSNYLGKITIDKKDIKDIDLTNILMLDYNNLWFKDSTIIDNILYNKVLSSKDFYNLINNYLPNNFIKSFINDEGTEIKDMYNSPTYYKRLITFIRSINTDKDIIILDKPFNNISKYNQNIIEKELSKLNKTIIIISNTPPTLDNYTNIILLDNSLIKEQGIYEELIKEKRDFYRLINR